MMRRTRITRLALVHLNYTQICLSELRAQHIYVMFGLFRISSSDPITSLSENNGNIYKMTQYEDKSV